MEANFPSQAIKSTTKIGCSDYRVFLSSTSFLLKGDIYILGALVGLHGFRLKLVPLTMVTGGLDQSKITD